MGECRELRMQVVFFRCLITGHPILLSPGQFFFCAELGAKLEIRNPKQIQITEIQMTKTPRSNQYNGLIRQSTELRHIFGSTLVLQI